MAIIIGKSGRNPSNSHGDSSQDADFDGSGTLDREEFVEICSLAKNAEQKNGMKGECVIGLAEEYDYLNLFDTIWNVLN